MSQCLFDSRSAPLKGNPDLRLTSDHDLRVVRRVSVEDDVTATQTFHLAGRRVELRTRLEVCAAVEVEVGLGVGAKRHAARQRALELWRTLERGVAHGSKVRVLKVAARPPHKPAQCHRNQQIVTCARLRTPPPPAAPALPLDLHGCRLRRHGPGHGKLRICGGSGGSTVLLSFIPTAGLVLSA